MRGRRRMGTEILLMALYLLIVLLVVEISSLLYFGRDRFPPAFWGGTTGRINNNLVFSSLIEKNGSYVSIHTR